MAQIYIFYRMGTWGTAGRHAGPTKLWASNTSEVNFLIGIFHLFLKLQNNRKMMPEIFGKISRVGLQHDEFS